MEKPGLGLLQHSQDLTKAINAYEKAFEFEKNEPVYYAELDPLVDARATLLSKRSKAFLKGKMGW